MTAIGDSLGTPAVNVQLTWDCNLAVRGKHAVNYASRGLDDAHAVAISKLARHNLPACDRYF
jgi:hypothetical protein